MSLDLQIFVYVLSGVVVPLILYLLSRGPALRQLKTTTDAAIVTSATELASALQVQVEFLTKKITALESDRNAERINYTNQLNVAYSMVAELKTNQDIDRRQIAELKAAHLRLEMKISNAELTPSLSPDEMNDEIAKLQHPDEKNGT